MAGAGFDQREGDNPVKGHRSQRVSGGREGGGGQERSVLWVCLMGAFSIITGHVQILVLGL